ncbi:MAG TPA: cytochrome c peroxidase [Kofleriaceae bacterium]|nr:cytochrome c peroxidase [Kofleriaceae bacterium]
MRSTRVALSLLTLLAAACGQESEQAPDLGPRPAKREPIAPLQGQGSDGINPRLLRRFKALSAVIEGKNGAGSEAVAQLGHKLYFDKRLSADRTMSCNSCHRLETYGVDNQPTSLGHRGLRGRRNSPSVFNAAGQLAQFWDGRALDVEEQAKGPIINPIEMAMVSPARVVAMLKSIPLYVDEFALAFPGTRDPINYDNVGRAIGAFERRLVTHSRWDRFLDGDHAALSAVEIAGLKLFADVGCIQCHNGEFLGGSMFQKVGAAEAWPNQTDPGRFDVTHLEVDRMQFKVPSLRNVAETGPYFHDGSIATLAEAVTVMSRYQLGSPLAPAEVASIVAWLGSLTGDLPAAYVSAPVLPPDGPNTAKLASR